MVNDKKAYLAILIFIAFMLESCTNDGDDQFGAVEYRNRYLAQLRNSLNDAFYQNGGFEAATDTSHVIRVVLDKDGSDAFYIPEIDAVVLVNQNFFDTTKNVELLLVIFEIKTGYDVDGLYVMRTGGTGEYISINEFKDEVKRNGFYVVQDGLVSEFGKDNL